MVEKDPPKKRFELEGFREMVDTGPFSPVKGMACHDDEDVDQSATLLPFPFGP